MQNSLANFLHRQAKSCSKLPYEYYVCAILRCSLATVSTRQKRHKTLWFFGNLYVIAPISETCASLLYVCWDYYELYSYLRNFLLKFHVHESVDVLWFCCIWKFFLCFWPGADICELYKAPLNIESFPFKWAPLHHIFDGACPSLYVLEQCNLR